MAIGTACCPIQCVIEGAYTIFKVPEQFTFLLARSASPDESGSLCLRMETILHYDAYHPHNIIDEPGGLGTKQ